MYDTAKVREGAIAKITRHHPRQRHPHQQDDI